MNERINQMILFGIVAALSFAASDGQAQELVDQRGRKFSFSSPAQRVVFLPMPAPSTYIAIDGTERHIVGINAGSAAAMRTGILGRLFPGTRSISTDVTSGAGFTPNIEAILALHPDAVFQWTTAGEEPIALLDRAGLTTLGMRYGTQQDMAGYVAMMGVLSGKSEHAAEIMRRQQERLDSIATALAGLPDPDRPRVLYLGRVTDSFRSAGAGSYTDFYIGLAGGRNVAASGQAAVSNLTLEQILTWDPDIVLLGNFDTTLPKDLYSDPRWKNVAAVRAHRVYRMPLGGYRWDPPSLESALTWTWLAGLLHPDRIKQDLRQDMGAWYRLLYNHELTKGEMDSILFVEENAQSAGYDRYGKP